MSKSNRNPKATELDIYRSLRDNEGYHSFQLILSDFANLVTAQMANLVITDKDIAEHNQRVGLLQGIMKARTTVDAIIKELERELKIEEQKQSQGKTTLNHQPY